jgi:o-succinylbenzoate---CoA ligase
MPSFDPNWLRQRAYLTPERIALIAGGEHWTFRELHQRVESAAQRLATWGAGPGSRVALLLRNGLDFATFVYAGAPLGVELVLLNTRLTRAEIEWQLADVQANYLIYDEHNADTALTAGSNLPILQLFSVRMFSQLAIGDAILRTHVKFEATHCVIYTSGTTGKPKGARLSYGNLWWSASDSALNLGIHTDDVWLAILPLFHVGGLSILMRSVIYGNTAIVHQTFDPVAVNRAIDEQRVTMISVVSTMLQRMLDARGDQPYPTTLRCVLLGGGPAPQPLLEACAARGLPVVQTYGLTETASQIATLPPEDALRKLGSAGKPLFHAALKIESNGLSLPAGEVGEIVVRGPTVIRGYVNDSETPTSAIRNGWLHTGDLGYLDAEGYLYVVSRRVDLIVSGGENVYPAEIEAVLLAHPAVEEVGVAGVPDRHWGQVPAAAIKLRAGAALTQTEVQAFCADRLARYKIPTHIWFVEELPHNAAGKLVRSALIADWETQVGPGGNDKTGQG